MKKSKWIVSLDGNIRERKLVDAGYSDYICSMPFSTPDEADEMPGSNNHAQMIVCVPEMLELLEDIKSDMWTTVMPDKQKRIDVILKFANKHNPKWKPTNWPLETE